MKRCLSAFFKNNQCFGNQQPPSRKHQQPHSRKQRLSLPAQDPLYPLAADLQELIAEYLPFEDIHNLELHKVRVYRNQNSTVPQIRAYENRFKSSYWTKVGKRLDLPFVQKERKDDFLRVPYDLYALQFGDLEATYDKYLESKKVALKIPSGAVINFEFLYGKMQKLLFKLARGEAVVETLTEDEDPNFIQFVKKLEREFSLLRGHGGIQAHNDMMNLEQGNFENYPALAEVCYGTYRCSVEQLLILFSILLRFPPTDILTKFKDAYGHTIAECAYLNNSQTFLDYLYAILKKNAPPEYHANKADLEHNDGKKALRSAALTYSEEAVVHLIKNSWGLSNGDALLEVLTNMWHGGLLEAMVVCRQYEAIEDWLHQNDFTQMSVLLEAMIYNKLPQEDMEKIFSLFVKVLGGNNSRKILTENIGALSPLVLAAQRGNLSAVKFILSKLFDEKFKDYKLDLNEVESKKQELLRSAFLAVMYEKDNLAYPLYPLTDPTTYRKKAPELQNVYQQMLMLFLDYAGPWIGTVQFDSTMLPAHATIINQKPTLFKTKDMEGKLFLQEKIDGLCDKASWLSDTVSDLFLAKIAILKQEKTLDDADQLLDQLKKDKNVYKEILLRLLIKNPAIVHPEVFTEEFRVLRTTLGELQSSLDILCRGDRLQIADDTWVELDGRLWVQDYLKSLAERLGHFSESLALFERTYNSVWFKRESFAKNLFEYAASVGSEALENVFEYYLNDALFLDLSDNSIQLLLNLLEAIIKSHASSQISFSRQCAFFEKIQRMIESRDGGEQPTFLMDQTPYTLYLAMCAIQSKSTTMGLYLLKQHLERPDHPFLDDQTHETNLMKIAQIAIEAGDKKVWQYLIQKYFFDRARLLDVPFVDLEEEDHNARPMAISLLDYAERIGGYTWTIEYNAPLAPALRR